jgi:hypothetical protein
MITAIRRKRDNRVLDTAQKGHPTYVSAPYFQAPQCCYDPVDNKSYIAWGQRSDSPYNRKGAISCYNHTTKLIEATTELTLPAVHRWIGTESDNWTDTHIHPVVQMDMNGFLTVLIEEAHNGRVRVFRSNAARSIAAFTEGAFIYNGTEAGFTGMGYPSLYRHRNFVLAAGREGYDYFAVVRSSDGGATYSAPVKVTNLGVANGAVARHYHIAIPQASGVSPTPNTTDPGFHAIVLRRNSSPSIHYSDLYYLHAPTVSAIGVTWNNRPNGLNGASFTATAGRNVISPSLSPFSETELNSSFRIKTNGGNSSLSLFPSCAMVSPQSNIPYLITRDAVQSKFCMHYLNPATNAWVENQFTLPGYTYGEIVQIGAMKVLQDDYIQVVATVDFGAVKRLLLFVTTDKGISWTFDRVLYTHAEIATVSPVMNVTGNVGVDNKFLWSVQLRKGVYSDLAFGEF